MKHQIYVLSAKRTPIGTFLGSLKNHSSVEMGVLSSQAAMKEAKVSGEEIVHSIFGNVCSVSGPDGAYLARHIGLRSGMKIGAGSLTVNRLCGSGFEAIAQASQYILEGPCLVGGSESMSQTPLLLRGTREGWKFSRPPASIDSLWEALSDQYAQMAMGETAELLAKEYEISREDCDRWAFMSHDRAAKAEQAGHFKKEMLAVEVIEGKEKKVFDRDEHIRRDTTIEKLAKLKPVFGGVTTAGNASGMNDAAASLVVADETYALSWSKRTGLKPLAKVVCSWAVGCDPKRMGIGPVEAIHKLCSELRWDLKSIPYVEVNEAFAAQVLSVKKALKLSDEQLNPHGSGISLGHPLGATGARISSHIVHQIAEGKFTKAIGSACIGGGQGIALAFEAV